MEKENETLVTTILKINFDVLADVVKDNVQYERFVQFLKASYLSVTGSRFAECVHL